MTPPHDAPSRSGCGDDRPVIAVACFGGTQPCREFEQAAASLGIELLSFAPDCSQPIESALATIVARRAVVTVPYGCDERDLDVLLHHPEVTVRPGLAIIRLSHDPLAARYFLHDLGYDVAVFEEVDSGDTWALTRFSRQHGWPVRLSSPRWAGTGRTVRLVRPYTELEQIWDTDGNLWLMEACEPLAPQLSVVLTRRPSGDQQTCSVTVTTQEDFLPRRRLQLPGSVARQAVRVAGAVADELDAVGLLTVKFLHTRDGRLLIDDLAYGASAAVPLGMSEPTSLVTAHLRAVADLPPLLTE